MHVVSYSSFVLAPVMEDEMSARQFSRAAAVAAMSLVLASPVLARGERYVDVATIRDVQQTLNARGFRAGGVDGIMGPRTQAAVRRFQQSENLESTGQLNRQTLAALGMQADSVDATYGAETIREVQRTLKNRGYHDGAVNGDLDIATQDSIRKFQESENLEASGQINPQTLAALGIVAAAAAERVVPAPSARTVRQVQQALRDRGFVTGPIDGVMGPMTSGALRQFQQSENLEPSGRLNDRTLSVLGVPTAG